MKNLKNISARVEISDLENLGWDFSNFYDEVSNAQGISLEDAEKWEKEHYHVKLKVDEKENLTHSLCQNAEYGNEEFDQGDCGDNQEGLKDFKTLIEKDKIWDFKFCGVPVRDKDLPISNITLERSREIDKIMETTVKNQYYIAGYLKGNEIGVIDLDGKFNVSDKLDFDSRMFFDSSEEAQSFIDKLQKEENHPNFQYQIEEVQND